MARTKIDPYPKSALNGEFWPILINVTLCLTTLLSVKPISIYFFAFELELLSVGVRFILKILSQPHCSALWDSVCPSHARPLG